MENKIKCPCCHGTNIARGRFGNDASLCANCGTDWIEELRTPDPLAEAMAWNIKKWMESLPRPNNPNVCPVNCHERDVINAYEAYRKGGEG